MSNQTTQIYQAINALSQKINDVNKRLDNFYKMITDKNSSDIDYIAMMEDIDLNNAQKEES